MSFSISQPQRIYSQSTSSPNKVLTCYTPSHSTIEEGTVSMVKSPSTARVTVSTNPSLVVIPAGVYLDAIEYQGESSFRASQAFKIGLGQLNNTISTPLIEGGTTQIANERGGGGRLLSGNSVNGANKIYTTAPTYINFVSEGDIQAGHLRVDLYYHTKG